MVTELVDPTCEVCLKAPAPLEVQPTLRWLKVCVPCADAICKPPEALKPGEVELRSRLRVRELLAAIRREMGTLRGTQIPGRASVLAYLDVAVGGLQNAERLLSDAERELAAREGR